MLTWRNLSMHPREKLARQTLETIELEGKWSNISSSLKQFKMQTYTPSVVFSLPWLIFLFMFNYSSYSKY
jgi:hypothetical protein